MLSVGAVGRIGQGGRRISVGGGGGGPVNEVPTIPGNPIISGTPRVGQTLTITPSGPVSGTPTPVRTIELYRNGIFVTEVPSLTYVPTTADYGTTLVVRQLETNDEGFDEAFSADFVIAPFSPADLFGVGDQGAFWDLSEPSALFQTLDTSTPVTAPGQNLSRINDLSGNGNHWLRTAGQPIYQENGDVSYMALDGVDDSMATASISGLMREGITLVIATRIASGGASSLYNPIFGLQGANANDFMRISVRNNIMRKSAITRLITNGRAQVQGPTDAADNQTPANTYLTLKLRFTDTVQNLAQDGTFLNDVAHAWANTDQIGAAITTGLGSFGVAREIVAALCITRILSAAEDALLDAWMDAKQNP